MLYENITALVDKHSDLCSERESLADEAGNMVAEITDLAVGYDVIYKKGVWRILGTLARTESIVFRIQNDEEIRNADWGELSDIQEKGGVHEA